MNNTWGNPPTYTARQPQVEHARDKIRRLFWRIVGAWFVGSCFIGALRQPQSPEALFLAVGYGIGSLIGIFGLAGFVWTLSRIVRVDLDIRDVTVAVIAAHGLLLGWWV